MKVATILGTRPEIIKLSHLIPLLDQEFEHILIHTGQHYDYNMDKVFFDDLHLPVPKYLLEIGSHPQGKQTALMLEKIEEILLKERPDLVIVEGDTNTVLAGSLAATKLHILLLHVEAGCRSFNRQMPEEINRIVGDHLADYLIAPDEKSFQNLIREGIPQEKIYLLGSTAFEAVVRNQQFTQPETVLGGLGLKEKEFVLVTLHRAENTDNQENLENIVVALNQLAYLATLVFPLHPRSKKILAEKGFALNQKIKVIEPQPYLNFLALLSCSKFCMTDSGGIQEEALVFNVPALILRNETEWIRLVEAGKNILLSTETEKIVSITQNLLTHETELRKIKEIKYSFEIGVSEKIMEVIKEIKK